MPENKDTKNTTDQNRSGGRQTHESEQGIDGEYGKAPGDPQSGGQGSAAQPQFDDEEVRRNIARDSKHTEPAAQEWSPGADQPSEK
ncbi:MAG: hypothetical protein LC734_05230 [Acidobacteria bacterium]|nr:hypothetical protein [Acidobacteriota bacterium]